MACHRGRKGGKWSAVCAAVSAAMAAAHPPLYLSLPSPRAVRNGKEYLYYSTGTSSSHFLPLYRMDIAQRRTEGEPVPMAGTPPINPSPCSD